MRKPIARRGLPTNRGARASVRHRGLPICGGSSSEQLHVTTYHHMMRPPYMGRLKSSANFMVLPLPFVLAIGGDRPTPIDPHEVQAAADHLT